MSGISAVTPQDAFLRRKTSYESEERKKVIFSTGLGGSEFHWNIQRFP